MQLIKDMGMDAYRFSLSWSRILPSKTYNAHCHTLMLRLHITLVKCDNVAIFCYFFTSSRSLMLVFLAAGKIEGGISQEGIDYYNNLINELIKNGKLVVQDEIYMQMELSSKLMVQ